MLVACVRGGDRSQSGRKGGFLQSARPDQAHAAYALDGRDHVRGAEDRPPAVARGLHELVARKPLISDEWRTIAAEASAFKVEAKQLDPVLDPRECDHFMRGGHEWLAGNLAERLPRAPQAQ